MSFFIRNKKQINGIKRSKFSNEKNKKRKPNETQKSSKQDDEISSSSDEGGELNEENDNISDSDDNNETAQEKKVRLAKLYLKEIEREEKERLEKEEIDSSVISKRLKDDYLTQIGKLRLTVADKYKGVEKSDIIKCREQRNAITCFCISAKDDFLFVGSKDSCIIKYSLVDNKKVGLIPFVKNNNEISGHRFKILSIAISSDSKFLAVGDESSDIQIWDPSTLKHIKTLKGHKKAVTGVTFQIDTHTLYSCSRDRTAKVWNLDEMSYVETLFGHQDEISSIDSLYRDRVVTSGCRDLRIWKITEETQLIYNGHNGNIDNVRLINEENFISGGDDGQLCVWSILRKKPLCCIQNAHGIDTSNDQPYWITAIAAHLNTDLVATGSQDGFVRLWKLENNFKTLTPLFSIPVEGFVNCLGFTSDGKKLIVGCAREHK